MREYALDTSTFIGGYYMPEEVCDFIIDYYKANTNQHIKGIVGEGVKEDIKKSTEIQIQPTDYKKFDRYLFFLQECLDRYTEKYQWANFVAPYRIVTPFKIQHYKPNEGFYKYHIENPGYYTVKGADFQPILTRHLTFMTYLNTLDEGGTEFLYQKKITPCQKGLTLIWPAGWTHPHRGIINKVSDKYIITGWYNFVPDEERKTA